MRQRILAVVVAMVFAVISLPAPSFAQTGLFGSVKDTTGGALPGVSVTLSGPALMGDRVSVTDAAGSYQFELQSPGTFSLRFELLGFQTLIRDGITVQLGRITTLNVTLDVAGIEEAVTVSGGAPVVDVQSATVGVNFTSEMLQRLPTSRNLWAVLAATPGVSMSQIDVGGSQGSNQMAFKTYGYTGQHLLMLDGLNVTEGTSGSGAIYMDYGMLSEVQIVAATKGAEILAPGTYVNMLVKSGSNRFSGDLYADYQGSFLRSDNLTDSLRAAGVTQGDRVQRWNDFNGSFGGPFRRDRLWFYYSTRYLYSGLASIGFTRPDGTSETFESIYKNHTAKFSARIAGSDDVSLLVTWNDKLLPNRGGGSGIFGEGQLFTTESAGRQWLTTPTVGTRWTSTKIPRSALDVSAHYMHFAWGIDRTKDGEGLVSRRDLDTRLVRGGWSGRVAGDEGAATLTTVPFDVVQPRFQTGATLTHFTDRVVAGSHTLKAGYVYQGETQKSRPFGTVGHVTEFYRQNFQVPTFIDVFSTPQTSETGLHQQSIFANDSWRLADWTLNLGVRYDRFTGYYPSQGNPGIGPYAEKTDFPARTLPSLGSWVPRLSVIYRLFGKEQTALKASYGRYAFQTSVDIANRVTPNSLLQRRYRWDGTQGWPSRGIPFVPRPQDLLVTFAGRAVDIDPNFRNAYTDEFTIGVDQELAPDVLARFNYVQRSDARRSQLINVAIPFSAYNKPVSVLDPGRDGLTGTGDDSQLTLYSLDPAFLGKFQGVLRSLPDFSNDYNAFDVQVVKRRSHKWEALAGLAVSHVDLLPSGVPQEPNLAQFTDRERYWEWNLKAQGIYEAPWNLTLSSLIRVQKGSAFGRQLRTPATALAQGSISVNAEAAGSYFLPTVKIWDARVERSFSFGRAGHHLSAVLDVFNVTNASTVLRVTTLTGPNFNRQITQITPPRVLRLGFRYSF